MTPKEPMSCTSKACKTKNVVEMSGKGVLLNCLAIIVENCSKHWLALRPIVNEVEIGMPAVRLARYKTCHPLISLN